MADSGYATQEQASQALTVDLDQDQSHANQSPKRIAVEDPVLAQVALLVEAVSSAPRRAESDDTSPPPLHECQDNDDDDTDDSVEGEQSEEEQSLVSLVKEKGNMRFVGMRKLMMKKFFIRSFLAKKYQIPIEFNSYKSFESLVSVEIYGTHEITWQVMTNGVKALTDALIEFYRDKQRCWFCSLSIKGTQKVLFKTRGDHIDHLMQSFLDA